MLELSTSKKILIEAQDLIQRHGFFGLSLQDLADRIAIRKPSLYAHYASKESLAVAVIRDLNRKFCEFEAGVKDLGPLEKFDQYLKNHEEEFKLGRVSPHAALALDGPNLPEAIRAAYLELQAEELRWLVSVFDDGKRFGVFGTRSASDTLALGVLQKVVGIELVARISGHSAAFCAARGDILFALQVAS
ncbi:MAG: TetR/AcrR family transcriptional regulator [Proteobacteria bacterium]|nr:TetR/AcrR family transcriptional regulator [Pseudomonadota bacterium]